MHVLGMAAGAHPHRWKPGMTAAALAALGVAGALAVADWFAVSAGIRRLEYVCKPGTMLALIGCAVLLRPASGVERTWFVAALALGMFGDVFLMLPRDRFLPGLSAFLLGHLAFVAGFVSGGQARPRVALAGVVLAMAAAILLPRILGGARSHRQATVVPALLAYFVVISLMVAAAFGSRQPLAIVPASLFLGSDCLIAFRRFVAPRPWMPLTITVTYHLAQAGLVLWLTL